MIGAARDDDEGNDSGSAYVFASDPVIVAIEDLIATVVSLNLQQGIRQPDVGDIVVTRTNASLGYVAQAISGTG